MEITLEMIPVIVLIIAAFIVDGWVFAKILRKD